MIAIIDYDAGNLKSVEKALAHIGEESVITREFQTILNADKVILPGVGAFGDAMANLKRLELDKVIRELNEKQTPFLGICLGLQLSVSYTHLDVYKRQHWFLPVENVGKEK